MAAKFSHVLDACSLIAYLKGEEGHDTLALILKDERNIIGIHAVNICEVYYDYLKSDGVGMAEEAWRSAEKISAIVEKADQGFMKRVARWKVDYSLGLADAFAAATAEEHACPLVTCDHNDFERIEASGVLDIVWLR